MAKVLIDDLLKYNQWTITQASQTQLDTAYYSIEGGYSWDL